MDNDSVVELFNARGHTMLSIVWGFQAGLCFLAFVYYLLRERPWRAIFLRIQLGIALAAVCFSDAWSGAIGAIFWFHVGQEAMAFQQYMLFVLVPLRMIASVSFLVAVRVVTFQQFGNKVWLTILLINFIGSWIIMQFVTP